jgi:enoyl-CoA hydratase
MAMSESSMIVAEVRDLILTLTISREKALNALNRKTLLELRDILKHHREDDSARAVIISGAGEKAFVAGADIMELKALSPQQAAEMSCLGQAVFNDIEDYPKPVIAAINGFALGGGCELAMACHIRIASENARFGQPEVKLGVIPGFGGTQRLPRLVGKGKALDLVLSGALIPAVRAAEIGLVDRVVAPENLMESCRQLATEIGANAPVAIRYCLSAVLSAPEMSLTEGQSLESSLFGLAFATQDMREGMQAFVEKRKPIFQGK